MATIEPKYTPIAHLQWLLDGVVERENHYAETGEDIDRKRLYKRGEAEVTPSLIKAWIAFEAEVASALGGWIALNPRCKLTSCTANEWVQHLMTFQDGALNVLSTLNGEGVGIWDGRWDNMIDCDEIDTNEKQTAVFESMGAWLREKLGKFADDCGGGSLNQAFEAAAYKPAKRARKAAV